MAASSRDWQVFTQLVADPWEPCQQAHPRYQTASYEGLVAQMLACSTPEKRGSRESRCLPCGQGQPLVALSCPSSFGLRCAQVSVDNWGSPVRRGLHAGVRYRHLLLTVPAMFRPTFSHHAEVVLHACMRWGAQCLDDF